MQEIDILVDGKPVRQIAHNGKIFVVAKEGAEYEIRLRNRGTSRTVGVCSVDGINVIDGKSAVSQGAGYIIHGYGSYNIKGFRISNEEVHPFVFNKKDESYAANSENGSIEDCGVIGATFWAEKELSPKVIEKHIHYDHYYDRWPWYPIYPKPYYPRPNRPWEPYWVSDTSNSGYSNGTTFTMSCSSNQMKASNQNTGMLRSANMAATADSFDMGTEFSQVSINDQVQTVEFEYGACLGTIEIYYASRTALKRMGVPVDRASEVTFPQAFKDKGFCVPPQKQKLIEAADIARERVSKLPRKAKNKLERRARKKMREA